MKTIFRLLFALGVLASGAQAQTAKSRAALYTDVTTNMASGKQMTAATVRTVLADVIASAHNITTDGAALVPTAGTMTTALDLLGSTRGSILYRGATGWTILAPGTVGYTLTSGGTGADPTWSVAAGSGTVTSASVVTANGVSATVANPTTTPAFTFTLGDITPSSIVATGNIGSTATAATISLGSTNKASLAVDTDGQLTITPKAGTHLTLTTSGVGRTSLNGMLFYANPSLPQYIVNSGVNAIDTSPTAYIVGGGSSGYPNLIGSTGLPAGTGLTPAGWSADSTYVAGSADVALIVGGYDNIVNQEAGVIVGGGHNFIKKNNGGHSFIGGGSYNVVSASRSGIVNGSANTITGASSVYNFIGGGYDNNIVGLYSAIPGGLSNAVTGNYSMSFGLRAKVTNTGSVAFSDATDADFTNAVANSIALRYSGGLLLKSGTLSVSKALGSDGVLGDFYDETTDVALQIRSNTGGAGLSGKHIDFIGTSSTSDMAFSPSTDTRRALILKDGGVMLVPGTGAHVFGTTNTVTLSDGNITATGTVGGSNLSGTNTGDQNLFSGVAVSGQTTVTANTTGTTLTLAEGTGIAITTNNTTKTVTINSTVAGNVTGSSLTANAVALGAGTNAISVLASLGNAGAPLLSAGTGAPPAFGALNLAGGSNIVTGNTAVGNGGTGTNNLTANNIIIGNNTGAVTFLAPGTSGNIVTSNGTVWASAVPTHPHAVIFSVNGNGSALTTGTKYPHVKTPWGGTLTGWTMTAYPSGSVTVDILRSADGAGLPTASIVGGSGTKPAIASGTENDSTSFTSWTSTTVTALDNFAINLATVDSVITSLTLVLYYQ